MCFPLQISKCDVLAILFRTFMSECEKKKNDRKKLEFHRNLNPQSFRRTIYILFDLKYLLSSNPVQVLFKTVCHFLLRTLQFQ